MKALKNLINRYKNNLKFYIGYPQNTEFDYSSLHKALAYPLNNYGDPFLLTNPVSSHEYEQEVIKWFLNLYGLDESSGWGYVTTGGTEGILFGIWQGKENLKNPVLYFSDHAHYSVKKAARITGLNYRIIKTSTTGEMDYNNLLNQLVTNQPAIVVATLGNTMTSAIDNVRKIREVTQQKRTQTFIHADAAFDGMVLPFIDSFHPYQLTQGIDSVSISGHKIIGSPIPCGVVLIHKNHVEAARNLNIDIIKNSDCTVSGSRPGFAALILWEAIAQKKYTGFKTLIQSSLKKAERFTKLLNDNNISAWRFDHAITIVLNQLPDPITQKWRAPSNQIYTTLTALPKLKESMLKKFIQDIQHYEKYGKLTTQNSGIAFPKLSDEILLEKRRN